MATEPTRLYLVFAGLTEYDSIDDLYLAQADERSVRDSHE
jgi:hypothetical protein